MMLQHSQKPQTKNMANTGESGRNPNFQKKKKKTMDQILVCFWLKMN